MSQEILIATNLKFLRTSFEESQAAFATKIGLPLKRYQSYEEERSQVPLELLLTLKSITGIPIDSLLTVDLSQSMTQMEVLKLTVGAINRNP